jgi:hypothetical protein
MNFFKIIPVNAAQNIKIIEVLYALCVRVSNGLPFRLSKKNTIFRKPFILAQMEKLFKK